MEFSEWLRRSRKNHPARLTQTRLAELSGINQRTISSLEMGESYPRLDTATALFLVFGEIFLPPSTVIALKPQKGAPHDSSAE